MLIARRQPMNGFYNDGLAGCACDNQLGTGDYVQLQGWDSFLSSIRSAAQSYFVGSSQEEMQKAQIEANAKAIAAAGAAGGAVVQSDAMDPTTKTLLIVGGVAVAGGLVYLLTQR